MFGRMQLERANIGSAGIPVEVLTDHDDGWMSWISYGFDGGSVRLLAEKEDSGNNQ